jgi:hypothetical protein
MSEGVLGLIPFSVAQVICFADSQFASHSVRWLAQTVLHQLTRYLMGGCSVMFTA